MSGLILSWNIGNMRIYTKRLDFAKEAWKNGYFVRFINEKPHIYGNI